MNTQTEVTDDRVLRNTSKGGPQTRPNRPTKPRHRPFDIRTHQTVYQRRTVTRGGNRGSAGPPLAVLATAFLWVTDWWALVLVCRCRGLVGRFDLSGGMCYAGRDLPRLCLRICHVFFLFRTCAPEIIDLRKQLWSLVSDTGM